MIPQTRTRAGSQHQTLRTFYGAIVILNFITEDECEDKLQNEINVWMPSKEKFMEQEGSEEKVYNNCMSSGRQVVTGNDRRPTPLKSTGCRLLLLSSVRNILCR